MNTILDTKNIKSDEQSLSGQNYRAINWVGMSSIQSYISENEIHIPTEVSMFVDLKKSFRGIHMSRLYLIHMNRILGRELSFDHIDLVIKEMVRSQEGLSSAAQVKFIFQSLKKTLSLVSELQGFRSYPVVYEFSGDASGLKKTVLSFDVIYSSTCPQSAKLSKEYLKNQISNADQAWNWVQSEQVFHAVPHAQRSLMRVSLLLKSGCQLTASDWIERIEKTLQTAVQTAVKKPDEMEFARLNAENTMFCEDAARRVADDLENFSEVEGFQVSSTHYESLHPHNAYSQISVNFS